MFESGVHSVVGDNSRPELVNAKNPYYVLPAPITTSNPSGNPTGTGPVLDLSQAQVEELSKKIDVIPRFATRVYFDCSLPEENAKEHDGFYGPNCVGFDQVGPVVGKLIKNKKFSSFTQFFIQFLFLYSVFILFFN